MRRASERPMGRGEIVVRKVRPGLDEALRVERHTGFPCELTRTKSGDKLFVGPRRANNLQTPRSDDEATRILCACFDKDVANLNRIDAAMAGYTFDLFRFQYREHPFRSRGHTCQ